MKKGNLFVLLAVTVCNLVLAIAIKDASLVFVAALGAAGLGPMAFPITWSRTSVPLALVATLTTLALGALWILQGFPLLAFLSVTAAALVSFALATVVYAGHRGALDRPFSRPASG